MKILGKKALLSRCPLQGAVVKHSFTVATTVAPAAAITVPPHTHIHTDTTLPLKHMQRNQGESNIEQALTKTRYLLGGREGGRLSGLRFSKACTLISLCGSTGPASTAAMAGPGAAARTHHHCVRDHAAPTTCTENVTLLFKGCSNNVFF